MASWGRSDKLYNITAFGYEFARHAASEMRRMLLPCVGRARCGPGMARVWRLMSSSDQSVESTHEACVFGARLPDGYVGEQTTCNTSVLK
jgi:hypothetical protein